MRLFLVFCVTALTIWACGTTTNERSTESEATASTSAKPKIDGKKIYKQYCVTCHGLYGDMGASGALNLQQATLSLEERTTVITKGRGAMTPFENLLSEEEIAAVAEYTLELRE